MSLSLYNYLNRVTCAQINAISDAFVYISRLKFGLLLPRSSEEGKKKEKTRIGFPSRGFSDNTAALILVSQELLVVADFALMLKEWEITSQWQLMNEGQHHVWKASCAPYFTS